MINRLRGAALTKETAVIAHCLKLRGDAARNKRIVVIVAIKSSCDNILNKLKTMRNYNCKYAV